MSLPDGSDVGPHNTKHGPGGNMRRITTIAWRDQFDRIVHEEVCAGCWQPDGKHHGGCLDAPCGSKIEPRATQATKPTQDTTDRATGRTGGRG